MREKASFSADRAASVAYPLPQACLGDWKMPVYRAARTNAASQGWLIVEDDTLTVTTAGLATT
jgi:hypothetical protein